MGSYGYGSDAVTELLNITMDVPALPANLPGQVVTSQGVNGFQITCPSGPNQGKVWTPGRAYINVETGALRIKCDGTDPDAGLGTLYVAGQVIDWSSPLGDYAGMIRRARLCRENSGTATKITISYRN